MRWFAALLLVGALAGCADRELDLAAQIVVAEEAEASARRELVRLERQPETPELVKQIAAQREVVRAAEITSRKLRIQSKQ